MQKKKQQVINYTIKFILLVLILGFVSSGITTIWAISLPVPDFETFFEKQINQASTKIYDRTGKTLLYDVRGIRRTVVSFEKIPSHIKQATLAIEDAEFYTHKGVDISSIARAFWVNLVSGGIHQGGSTITQQVVKNSLLTQEKTLTRKIKEAILAVKMEQTMSKDDILNIYLNESPYGSNIYGVQEAAKAYFKKDINDITLAEAAYLASLPQAPGYYSPYGKNKAKLDDRKNLVLNQMVKNDFITEEEAEKAKVEEVVFYEKINQSIKAPHFVFFIKEYLENKYGADNIQNKGYKVITTIDWDLQQKAEELAKKHGEENENKFNAQNNGVVAIDPKTGQILAMVGSRDYFNQDIEGNFNVTTAHRQPGSSFKPIVYATAFNKGYTDKTVVFDLKTEFNTNCSPTGIPLTTGAQCYSPVNYDDKFVGPITLREALAQSRNIPAIKVLYLAGINNSLNTARSLGISSLSDKNQYGLTLVLGGGEVSLLEMTGAYSVFANEGIKNKITGILKVANPNEKIVEEFISKPEIVMPENTARIISNILSDDDARAPAYGYHSLLYFSNKDVAVKTGTTNDYKDAWIIGYTPNIVIGAWAGNNDNTPMAKKVAGYIITPLWHDVMQTALNRLPDERFIPPILNYEGLKPIMKGYWQGGEINFVDLPNQQNLEYINNSIHSILYWIDKNNPTGQSPSNPQRDPQFNLWEYPVKIWATNNNLDSGKTFINTQDGENLENNLEDISFNITSPKQGDNIELKKTLRVVLDIPENIEISQINYFLNNYSLGTNKKPPYTTSFTPSRLKLEPGSYDLRVVVYDKKDNPFVKSITINLIN
ncbi:MAG: PBP1A family penicillin-binding protein [Candidatus Paceibacterota bacterium]|jgi:1A family penicillin-binding protein